MIAHYKKFYWFTSMLVIGVLVLAACAPAGTGSTTETPVVPNTGSTSAPATTAPGVTNPTSLPLTSGTPAATSLPGTSAPATTSMPATSAPATSAPAATSMPATSAPASGTTTPVIPNTGLGSGTATWLSTANDPKLGNILVDSKGMTLYVFSNDTTDTSTCTGSCATLWPPYVVSSSSATAMPGSTAMPATTTMPAATMPAATAMPAATMPAATAMPGTTAMPNSGLGGILDPTLIGTAKLADGTMVVTYNHHVLYHYSKDQKPGDTLGQGIGGLWWTVDTTGKPVSITK
jgi:predicted lipoprotein with Yx(FWY)xxD motif